MIWIGCLLASSMLTISYILELQFALEPCVLCLGQRYILYPIIALLALSILTSRSRFTTITTLLFNSLCIGFALVLSARLIYIQAQPELVLDCAPGLEYVYNTFGFLESLKTLLTGSKDCHSSQVSFAYLSLAQWTLLAFIALFYYNMKVLYLYFKQK